MTHPFKVGDRIYLNHPPYKPGTIAEYTGPYPDNLIPVRWDYLPDTILLPEIEAIKPVAPCLACAYDDAVEIIAEVFEGLFPDHGGSLTNHYREEAKLALARIGAIPHEHESPGTP